MQALRELDYPERLQKMLLTPQREVHVELIITRDRRGRPLPAAWQAALQDNGLSCSPLCLEPMTRSGAVCAMRDDLVPQQSNYLARNRWVRSIRHDHIVPQCMSHRVHLTMVIHATVGR